MKNVIEKDCCFENDGFYFRYRAAAIIVEEDCVLMAYNEKEDYYYGVGGGVHMGESSSAAVIREVMEETGFRYEIERLAFVNESMYYDDLSGRQCHVIEFYYLMKPKGNKFLLNNNSGDGMSDDVECLKWLPLDEVRDNKKVFPIFYRDKLMEIPNEIMHFISDQGDEG